DGIRDKLVTGVKTCALPILPATLLPPGEVRGESGGGGGDRRPEVPADAARGTGRRDGRGQHPHAASPDRSQETEGAARPCDNWSRWVERRAGSVPGPPAPSGRRRGELRRGRLPLAGVHEGRSPPGCVARTRHPRLHVPSGGLHRSATAWAHRAPEDGGGACG